LQHGNPIYSFRFDAGESPGTFVVATAKSAAKTARLTIVEADIFRPPYPLAIIGVDARLAKMRMAGDADPGQVRRPGASLLAEPPRGTLFLAGLGADRLAHMFHAPPLQTVFIRVAWVEKATGPWLTFLEGAVEATTIPKKDLYNGDFSRAYIGGGVRSQTVATLIRVIVVDLKTGCRASPQ